MLKPITFTVDVGSGPLKVTASGPDYIAYETTFGASVLTALSERRYAAWLFLVWHALNRQKLSEMTWDEFVASTPEFASGEPEEIVPLES
jgi:homogentisate 1,2-dioxygenase